MYTVLVSLTLGERSYSILIRDTNIQMHPDAPVGIPMSTTIMAGVGTNVTNKNEIY